MNEQPRKGLTIIQWLLLVALLGLVLTIAASIWQGPAGIEAENLEAESPVGNAESQ